MRPLLFTTFAGLISHKKGKIPMIYLTSTTERKTIMIPNAYGFREGGDAVLLLLSTVDLLEFERRIASGGSFDYEAFSSAFRIGEAAAAQLTADGLYVRYYVSFDRAPVVGSFEYRLLQDGTLVGGGCCQVGKYGEEQEIYEVPTEQFDKTIQYEQYN